MNLPSKDEIIEGLQSGRLVLNEADFNQYTLCLEPSPLVAPLDHVARFVHEINRAYSLAVGETGKEPWESTSEEDRSLTYRMIKFVWTNPEVTDEEIHAGWCQQRKQGGWVYGPVKDPIKKEHPCLVPYSELPQEQRIKDSLVRAVINLFRN